MTALQPDYSNAEVFWKRVEESDGCMLWMGSRTTAGYGNLRLVGGTYDYAHRIAYRLTKGQIPEGLVLDHLCRVRHCVNPDHLEAVHHIENVRRGLAPHGVIRTTCKRGHDITDPDNIYVQPSSGARHCRPCMKWHADQKTLRRREASRYAAVRERA